MGKERCRCQWGYHVTGQANREEIDSERRKEKPLKGKCIGFVLPGSGSDGAAGEASMRSCQKIPPCVVEPMPAGSRMDPPLAKAKAIRNHSNASGITYLRRKKSCCADESCGQRRAEQEHVNNYADTKVSGEGGKEVLQVPEQRCSYGTDHGEAAVPLQPMEDHRDAKIHLQPGEGTHTRAGGCLKEAVTLWEAHAGAGFWQGPDNPQGEDPNWSRFSW
ncbi:hypothetical protein WISP_20382 [Willisornis vidua]|uniref:Uncharacterized protein n=1 Tax=Willisornis vidua TaxID=1566151 RepID=A0ABQ9DNE9_9PASS|nr:hypothetical protein WISP_20382 [Willisornis vidua]